LIFVNKYPIICNTMGQKTLIGAIILIIFAVILAVLFVVSRLVGGGEPDGDREKLVVTTTPAANVVKDPFVYDNLELEIESQISDWVTKNSFTLSAGGTPGFLGGAPRDLYVIFDSPFVLPHQTTDENELGLGELVNVNIKGQARILDREEVEDALGISLDDDRLALDDSTVNEWEFGILFLAESVEKVE